MKKTIFRILMTAGILAGTYGLYACQSREVSADEGIEIKAPGSAVAQPGHDGPIAVKDFDKLIAGDKLVMVDFYAVWCGPCKRMAPFVEQVKNEMKDQVTVLSIDAEAQPEISGRYNLEGYPTLIFFKKGQVVANAIGYHNKEQIAELVNKFK